MQDHANAYKVTMIFVMEYEDGNLKLARACWNRMTNEFREKVTEWKSGFTEITVRGEWRSVEDNDSRMYSITVSTLEQVEWLRNFVKDWRIPFGQKTMYFDYHPVHFELVSD